MKICIDISQIVYKGSGVARFTEGLVKTICEYDQENEWIFFFSSLRRTLDTNITSLIEKRGYRLISYRFPPSVLTLLWNDLHIFSIDSLVGSVDWYISSDWTESPSSAKKATVLHDLSYIRFPETVDKTISRTQKGRIKWVRKETNVIFTDSEMTKQDAKQFLSITDDRLSVNYPGVSKKQTHWKELTNQKKYILTVGKIEPRKNFAKLVEAFKSLKDNDIELYIVGADGWGDVHIDTTPNVKLLGYVSESKLSELYTNCLCFIYPSLWEGFGYPVAEAMSYGAPVLTSNTSSLGEIAKDAALLFDPTKTDDIARQLKRVISDKILRDKLSKKGLKRSENFAWKTYYGKMISVLKSKS